ncbi:MAG: hypothetical protein H6607_01280 [Flavobacteriales bacterium]|nr:hypothetical protein [Flavobacteriales bacterium]
MSKDSFNWKKLFINEDEATNAHNEKSETPKQVSFPENNAINSEKSNSLQTNPYLEEILKVYENGFNTLNLSDFDFFELYKSVMATGVNSQQSYQMAFTIGQSIKPDLTKEFLLDKANYYIIEIEKVHTQYQQTGNSKKMELDSTLGAEKSTLSNRIKELEKQISQLQQELDSSKARLEKMDDQNEAKYTEVQLKLEANNLAKTKLLDSIYAVVNGIKNYL